MNTYRLLTFTGTSRDFAAWLRRQRQVLADFGLAKPR